jgi:accessory gene regulator B
MQKIVDRITRYCVNEKIVSPEDVPWLQYGLEKRISTLIVGIPFLIVAFAISNFLCALSFFFSYFYVRKYSGGYHAKTICGCLTFSLLLVLIFLGILPYLLTPKVLWGLLGISILTILRLAPYNHPNLHLTSDEIKACQKSEHIRVYVASLICLFAFLAGFQDIAYGSTIGIAMVATLLCLGYIHDWRNTHNERKNH